MFGLSGCCTHTGSCFCKDTTATCETPSALKERVDQVLRLCLRFLFGPRCLQDDTEEGMRRSNAQHRLDHSQIAVVPQCGTQDPHSVSLSTGMLVS